MSDEQLLQESPGARPCTHQRVKHPHGSMGRYAQDGCRCAPCREARSAYRRHVYRQRGYGRWQAFADTGPVLAHLQQLEAAGMRPLSIARRAGLSKPTVQKLLSRDPPKRILTRTANALLAVTAGRTTSPRTAGALFALKEDV